jgi:polyphenol oxidase
MSFETCPLLDELDWLKHGFFKRLPTVPFTCTEKQSDSPFLKELNATGELYFCRHVFEDHIITPYDWHDGIEADAWVTDEAGKGLATKTADCIPLLLACTRSRVIANVHISWHCCLKNLTAKTVAEMDRLGADPKHIIAAIGPHLQRQSFFVQEDLHGKFAAVHPEALVHFIPYDDEHWLLDMAGITKQQLQTAGVQTIWQSPYDTLTSAEHYSWRKREIDPDSEKSRNVSIIMKINP